MRPQTNTVAEWIIARIAPLKTALNIKTVIQGDFTNLPAPEEIAAWANILLVKPTYNEIEHSNVDGLYEVHYYFNIYFMREFSTSEPINASLIEESETIAEALYELDSDDRLPDQSPILEAFVTRIDYDSDVEGLLRVLDLDVTASRISFRLKAEQ